MSAKISKPGWWLVALSDGEVLLSKYTGTGSVTNAKKATFLSTSTPTPLDVQEGAFTITGGSAGNAGTQSNLITNASAAIKEALSKGSAVISAKDPSLLQQAGDAAVFLPVGAVAAGGAGAEADGAEASAAEGAAGGAGAATAAEDGSSLLSKVGTGAAILTIWAWLSTPSHWLLILKYVGGAVLLFFGLRELVDKGA